VNINDTKWVTLFGDVVAQGNSLRYNPVPSQQPQEGAGPAVPFVGLAKSSIYFNDGVIKLKVRLNEGAGRAQVVLGHGTPQQVFAGLNVGTGAFGIAVWQDAPATAGNATAPAGGAWVRNVSGGTPGKLPIDRDMTMQVKVLGSSVTLILDGVEVATTNAEIQQSQICVYLWGNAPVTAELLSVDAHRPTAFVVMQFTPEFDALYENVIQPTCKTFGYDTVRADDIFNNGLIIEDISRSIREASLIIADITPKNPNVFYEVGFAHAIGKPTILMAERKLESLPFDVAAFRTIFYDDSIGGKTKVEERLAHHLQALSGRTA
jgi:hypothetical protein